MLKKTNKNISTSLSFSYSEKNLKKTLEVGFWPLTLVLFKSKIWITDWYWLHLVVKLYHFVLPFSPIGVQNRGLIKQAQTSQAGEMGVRIEVWSTGFKMKEPKDPEKND